VLFNIVTVLLVWQITSPARPRTCLAKAKDFGSRPRPRPRTQPSRPRPKPRTQNLSSRTAQGQGPRPRTTTLHLRNAAIRTLYWQHTCIYILYSVGHKRTPFLLQISYRIFLIFHGPEPFGTQLISESRPSTGHHLHLKLQDHGYEAGVSSSCLLTSQLSPVPIHTAW